MSSRVLPKFDVLNPRSVSEACEMLSAHGNEIAVLAGGTDMLVWNYIRKINPSVLLSLNGIPGLDFLEDKAGEGLRIGAKARVARLLTDEVVKAKYTALYDAAFTFATPQIRNMGTVVGNVMRGSPAGDCSCAVLALGAEVILEGPQGRRSVDIDDFWVGYGKTARKQDELAVELRIKPPTKDTRSGFHRLTRVHEDLSKLNVAVRLELDGDVVRNARFAMGCVGPTLVRLKKSEALLTGSRLTEDVFRELAATVPLEIEPIDDQRSTAEYRRQVAPVVLRRLIERVAKKN